MKICESKGFRFFSISVSSACLLLLATFSVVVGKFFLDLFKANLTTGLKFFYGSMIVALYLLIIGALITFVNWIITDVKFLRMKGDKFEQRNETKIN